MGILFDKNLEVDGYSCNTSLQQLLVEASYVSECNVFLMTLLSNPQ